MESAHLGCGFGFVGLGGFWRCAGWGCGLEETSGFWKGRAGVFFPTLRILSKVLFCRGGAVPSAEFGFGRAYEKCSVCLPGRGFSVRMREALDRRGSFEYTASAHN